MMDLFKVFGFFGRLSHTEAQRDGGTEREKKAGENGGRGVNSNHPTTKPFCLTQRRGGTERGEIFQGL